MGPKEEGIILGELRGFKESALTTMNEMKTDIALLREDVNALKYFKWKVTGMATGGVLLIQVAFSLVKAYFQNKP